MDDFDFDVLEVVAVLTDGGFCADVAVVDDDGGA